MGSPAVGNADLRLWLLEVSEEVEFERVKQPY